MDAACCADSAGRTSDCASATRPRLSPWDTATHTPAHIINTVLRALLSESIFSPYFRHSSPKFVHLSKYLIFCPLVKFHIFWKSFHKHEECSFEMACNDSHALPLSPSLFFFTFHAVCPVSHTSMPVFSSPSCGSLRASAICNSCIRVLVLLSIAAFLISLLASFVFCLIPWYHFFFLLHTWYCVFVLIFWSCRRVVLLSYPICTQTIHLFHTFILRLFFVFSYFSVSQYLTLLGPQSHFGDKLL